MSFFKKLFKKKDAPSPGSTYSPPDLSTSGSRNSSVQSHPSHSLSSLSLSPNHLSLSNEKRSLIGDVECSNCIAFCPVIYFWRIIVPLLPIFLTSSLYISRNRIWHILKTKRAAMWMNRPTCNRFLSIFHTPLSIILTHYVLSFSQSHATWCTTESVEWTRTWLEFCINVTNELTYLTRESVFRCTGKGTKYRK